jgi:hypothetical protein
VKNGVSGIVFAPNSLAETNRHGRCLVLAHSMGKDIRIGAKCMAAMLACMALAQAAQGEIQPDKATGGESYGSITNRNIFALVDEIIIPNRLPPLPPSTDVKLTGIATVDGMKQAFFILNEPARDKKAPAAHSVILCEGQAFGKLKVLAIDPKARSVKVRNDQTESVIGFNAAEAGK